ncbi:hypothetical protein NHF46_17830 [Arthrobacter alpinus]|nr:hypothetical protein [Arthrobacter alpinus]
MTAVIDSPRSRRRQGVEADASTEPGEDFPVAAPSENTSEELEEGAPLVSEQADDHNKEDSVGTPSEGPSGEQEKEQDNKPVETRPESELLPKIAPNDADHTWGTAPRTVAMTHGCARTNPALGIKNVRTTMATPPKFPGRGAFLDDKSGTPRPVTPPFVTVAACLLGVAALMQVIATISALVYSVSAERRAALEAQIATMTGTAPSLNSLQNMGVLTVVMAGLVTVGAYVLFGVYLRKGRSWARLGAGCWWR